MDRNSALIALIVLCVLMAALVAGAIWLTRKVFTGWLERNGWEKK